MTTSPVTDFVPAATGAIDLDRPLADLDLGLTADGRPYGSMLALVRLHGEPLATVELPLEDGRISSEKVLALVGAGARAEIDAHVRAHGCEVDSTACPGAAATSVNAPFVTVIVPTAGRPERIRACVRALCAMTYPNFDILIVDNTPDVPGTREAVAECAIEDPRVRYAAEPLPGSSVARNRGVRVSSAELLAFTDDDVEVDREWLTWMVAPFLDDPQVGVVTGLVMPARLDTPQQRTFEELSGFGKGLERRRYDTGPNFAHDRLLFPYWGAVFGSGNSMAFRRHVLLELGGFDPALGAGSPARAGADIESFSHALLRGHRLVYEPRAVCWHDHRASELALTRQTFNYGAGCTAILTKWMLRDRRLLPLLLRQLGGLAGQLLGRGTGDGAGGRPVPHELARLSTQLTLHRSQGRLSKQFGGFLVGPFLYARSLVWTRRLRLRDVIGTGG